MNQIIAIASLSIRTAIRSRILQILLTLLMAALVVFPRVLISDGTLEGIIRIMLQYTLGSAFVVLSIATMWAACGSISTEVQTRTLHMLFSKPVPAARVWLGKWLGLCVLNFFLLTGCAAIVAIQVQLTLKVADATEAEIVKREILVGRQEIEPDDVRFMEKTIRSQLPIIRKQKNIADDVPDSIVYRTVVKEIKTRPHVVPTDGQHNWTFTLDEPLAPGHPLQVKFKMASSLDRDNTPILGKWLVRTDTGQSWTHQSHERAGAFAQFSIPYESVTDARSIQVSYINNDHQHPSSVLFNWESSIRLYAWKTHFTTNLLRACTLLFILLALIAAVGITTGCSLTLPVAAFTTLFFISMPWLVVTIHESMSSAPTATSHAGHDHGPNEGHEKGNADTKNTVVTSIHQATYTVLSPVTRFHPVQSLPDGKEIPVHQLLEALFFCIGIYSPIFAIAGIRILNRREVGAV